MCCTISIEREGSYRSGIFMELAKSFFVLGVPDIDKAVTTTRCECTVPSKTGFSLHSFSLPSFPLSLSLSYPLPPVYNVHRMKGNGIDWPDDLWITGCSVAFE